ncbi:MAG: DUF4375 domain-containing protein [Clostridia bacterium]|nr:DUF4375 domain-containing protein [Clostridia bacterium]
MRRLLIAFTIGAVVTLAACSLINSKLKEEDLDSLDDEKFFEALMFRCVDDYSGINDYFESDEMKTIYVLMNFEIELENGGLCQFFCNPSGECAPYVSDALEQVGALDIKKIYDDFIAENNIDLNELSSFETDSVDDYIEQTKRFDYESFDEHMHDKDDLQALIVAYARYHIDVF